MQLANEPGSAGLRLLLRALSAPNRLQHAVVLTALFASIAFIAACLVIAARRVVYPYELEFMGGAMLDLVERVRAGTPLYGPPSVEGTPFLYAPGWYYALGALWSAVPESVPLRLLARSVSWVAAAWTGFVVFRLARHLGATPQRAVHCVAVFACGYALTDFWYDLERVDPLAMALGTTGVWIIARRSSWPALIGAAGLLIGAALVKQQLVFVAAGCVVGSTLCSGWRKGLALGLGLGGTLGAVWLLLDAASGGWFFTYCFELPRAHGIEARRWIYVARDFTWGFMFLAGTVAVLRKQPRSILAASILAALGIAVLSRLHSGGWPNVMMPWLPLAAAGLATVPQAGRAGAVTSAAVLVQLLIGATALGRALPTAKHAASEQTIAAIVRRLEACGPVLLYGRGQQTTPRHLHSVAVQDWLRAGRPLWPELRAALEERRFKAVVLDSLEELAADPSGELLRLMGNHYSVSRQLEPLAALPSGFPAVPRWVLLPRPAALAEDRRAASRRLQEEAAAAERLPPLSSDGDRTFDCP